MPEGRRERDISGITDMAGAHQKNHDYHIIDPSPWPLLASIGAFVMAFGGICYMR
ncbi:MAG TPA: cytochrome c oxidase subunit 3, partial [Ensifer sp.]|nr:cytochrome c oxidase subunit 3 [Ensifer sp.]